MTPTNPLLLQTVDDPESERTPVMQALIRAYQDSSLKANKDPYQVVDEELAGISPGRKFLAGLVRGMAAAATNKPFQSLQESLVEREINKQQIASQQQNSALLRLQQLMGQQSREFNVGRQQENANYRVGEQIASRERIAQLRTDTAYANLEQRAEQFADKLELDWLERGDNLDWRDWQKQHSGDMMKLAERRVAAAEKRNDLLGRPDGYNYTPQSEEAKSLLDIVQTGNFGESRTKGQAQELMKEAKYLAENIDVAPEGPEKQRALAAAQSKILFLTENSLTIPEEKNALVFGNQTLNALQAAQDIMDTMTPEERGKLNYLSGTTEEWRRKFGVDPDGKLAQLHRLLAGHFFDFRQNMSGAAFSAAESAAYQSISPSTKSTFTLNQVLMNEMRRATVQGFLERIDRLGPAARDFFVKENVLTYKGRQYDITTGDDLTSLKRQAIQ